MENPMIRPTKSDFHPVIPNIIDETMREEADPDVVLIKNMSERKRLQKELETENPKQQKNKKSKSDLEKDKASIGRSIVIGILIVVITILVILLIYQLYKLFTTEENPLERPPPPRPPKKSNPIPDSVVTPPNKKIPDPARDMDIDVLSKYINKPASDNINKPRGIMQKTMIEDITPDPKKIDEEKRINDIIDSAMKKDEFSSIESEIPSREDETATLKDGLLEDQKERDVLFTVAEEAMPFLEDFGDGVQEIIESDNESDRPEGGGCQFVLTKGKNKGHVCGRTSDSGDRCNRHEDKYN